LRVTIARANEDLTSVQIRFNLDKGKTWSRVVRFFSDPSFFQETLDNGSTSATVRGTAFEVNLEKNYIRTSDHFVTLNKSNENVQLAEGESVFANKITQETSATNTDKAWEAWNAREDVSYLKDRFVAFQTELAQVTSQKNKDFLANMASSVQGALQ